MNLCSRCFLMSSLWWSTAAFCWSLSASYSSSDISSKCRRSSSSFSRSTRSDIHTSTALTAPYLYTTSHTPATDNVPNTSPKTVSTNNSLLPRAKLWHHTFLFFSTLFIFLDDTVVKLQCNRKHVRAVVESFQYAMSWTVCVVCEWRLKTIKHDAFSTVFLLHAIHKCQQYQAIIYYSSLKPFTIVLV